jgi:toxin ParE1/3/4
MRRFVLTPWASDDLKEIGRYSERNWGRKQRNQYLRDLAKRFIWLAENPNLGRHRTDINPEYYSFPEGQHIIFYQIMTDHIIIIGILHNRMDVASHLH